MDETKPTLRERNRTSLRLEITRAAMDLFVEQGFDGTTVDQIVAAAGISRRSFFHHFPSKEDVVLGDLDALGERVRVALEARPPGEDAWTALGEALRAMRSDDRMVSELALAQMYHDTPSLRARHLEKHLRWQELLAPNIADRMGLIGGSEPDPRARAVVAAALGCVDVAIEAWRASGGVADVERLYLECVEAIRS